MVVVIISMSMENLVLRVPKKRAAIAALFFGMIRWEFTINYAGILPNTSAIF
jgi:hypothetical protein